jgi:hypothetical protein
MDVLEVLGELGLHGLVFAVALVVPVHIDLDRVVDHIGISFVPADVPGVVKASLKGHGRLVKMIDIRDESGMDRLVPKNLRQDHIGRLQTLPSPERESVAAGEEGGSGRNRGKTFRVTLVKESPFLCEPVQIGRLDPIVAVATEVVPAKRVVDDDNDIHES